MISSPDRVVILHARKAGAIAGLLLVAVLLWFSEVGRTDQAEQPRRTVNLSATESVNADKSTGTVKPESASRQAGGDSGGTGANVTAPAIEYFEFPRPTENEKRIREALDKPTRVDFADTPLEKCVSKLRDIHKIPIIMDLSKIRDEGIVVDQPITLKAAGFSLRSILKLLLEPVSLAYFIENDMLKITISTGCPRTVVRIYPVGDLYRGAQQDGGVRRGDLERAIAKFVVPDTWEDLSGPGRMAYVEGTQSLVISQETYVHEEILDFLRVLREAKAVGEVPRHAPKQAARQQTWRLGGPRRDEAYSLAGLMELNGDPLVARTQLREIITAAGGRIDNEVGDDGTLFVDGRVEDRPHLSEKTKYLVVGRIPQPADLTDPERIGIAVKIAERLADLEDVAHDLGVPIVGLDEFLKYLGYEPSE